MGEQDLNHCWCSEPNTFMKEVPPQSEWRVVCAWCNSMGPVRSTREEAYSGWCEGVDGVRASQEAPDA